MSVALADQIATEAELSRLLGKSREWIRPRLSSIQKTGAGYRLGDVLPSLIGVADSQNDAELRREQVKSTIRKNEADAIGSEIDNETKLKSRIPIEVANEVIEAALSETKAIIKQSPLDDTTRKHVLDELNSVPSRLKW